MPAWIISDNVYLYTGIAAILPETEFILCRDNEWAEIEQKLTQINHATSRIIIVSVRSEKLLNQVLSGLTRQQACPVVVERPAATVNPIVRIGNILMFYRQLTHEWVAELGAYQATRYGHVPKVNIKRLDANRDWALLALMKSGKLSRKISRENSLCKKHLSGRKNRLTHDLHLIGVNAPVLLQLAEMLFHIRRMMESNIIEEGG